MGNLSITAFVFFFFIAFPFLKGNDSGDYEQRFFHLMGKGMSGLHMFSST